MRQLASIQRIDKLMPIEGRDRIVLASVLGWQVIVRKEDFVEGDTCVYVEIDSVLPPKPEFEFLSSKSYRVRTMKMAGVVSQGICFPMSILPMGSYTVGQDVTELLGIKQFEPEVDDPVPEPAKKRKNPLMRFAWYRKHFGKKRKNCRSAFPSFISKTDETRIQDAPFYLQCPEEQRFMIATEKVDGCSATYALRKRKGLHLKRNRYEFIVCSRNRRLPKNDGSAYWDIAERLHIRDKLTAMIGSREWIAVQGEIIGPKIQANRYSRNRNEFYVFNYITSDIGRFGTITMRAIMMSNGFSCVPIVDSHYYLPETVNEVLSDAHGPSMLAPDTLREGLVVRNENGQRSFKAVDPEYLMLHSI